MKGFQILPDTVKVFTASATCHIKEDLRNMEGHAGLTLAAYTMDLHGMLYSEAPDLAHLQLGLFKETMRSQIQGGTPTLERSSARLLLLPLPVPGKSQLPAVPTAWLPSA